MMHYICLMDKSLNKKHFNFANSSTVNIGVLSDTHTHINPNVFEFLNDCDVILHAGDIGSIEVIKRLQKISENVISVRGNNDDVNEHDDLQEIPQIAEVELPGGTIAITHGDEHFSEQTWHKKLRENFPDAKAIVYGHSHKLVCDQSTTPWVINPGAAGETRIQRNGVSCLRIAVKNENWEVTEFRV